MCLGRRGIVSGCGKQTQPSFPLAPSLNFRYFQSQGRMDGFEASSSRWLFTSRTRGKGQAKGQGSS